MASKDISIQSTKIPEATQEIEDVGKTSLNPLAGLSPEALQALADAFVDSASLPQERELFRKAAILAQNPDSHEGLVMLDVNERASLAREKEKKWQHPFALWFTIATCSVGAAVHGWDQTGSNGANLSFPVEFGIASNSSRDNWIVGLVNAAPTLATLVIGCWLSDPLNNKFGRRGAIFIAAVFSFASVLGSAFTQTWEQLMVCRLLLGIGMGVKAATTAMYAAECAPAAIRGALTMFWQLWVAIGIFLGFTANLVVMNTGDITWRLQLGSAMIPAIPLLLMIYACPESPRWYMKKHRTLDAYASLQKLRFTRLQAARDLFQMYIALEEEKALFTNVSSTPKRFTELFTIPRIRRANLAASTVMLAQQMCGINIISFYSSTIFVQSGVSPQTALWASWGFGLVNFTFAIPALWLIDAYGRRTLLLTTFPHMTWTLLVAGFGFLIAGDGTARLAIIALFIFVFTAFYSIGLGPVTYVYAAEVFPLSHRELGVAWACVINAAGATALSLTFPYILSALTPTGAFGLYAGLNALALLMIFLWVPETKQLTLEELDSIFAIKTWRFIRYQCSTVVPYWIRRWVFWRQDAVLEPLSLERVEF